MRSVVIALFILESFCCFAQDDSSTVHTDSVIDNYFCLKTSPLAFIDPWGGLSYRLGAEFKLIRNTAFSFEVGKYYGISKQDGLKKRRSVMPLLVKEKDTSGQQRTIFLEENS